MELTPQSQAAKLISEKENILLLAHSKLDGDSASSLLSLFLFLKKIGKNVTAVSAEGVPNKLSFLPSSDQIATTLSGMDDFVITVNCAEVEPQGLKYNLEEGKLFITITPKPDQKRSFVPSDVNFEKGIGNYDLIITVDAGDLEHLGRLYEEHTDLFYSVPIINIDHHASNTGFGKVNLVDTTAASTTELLYGLLRELQGDQAYIDADIATLLLAGLITDTGSFQNSNTTPKCLEVAAQLVELGARQQEIIQKIFKTRPLSTLRLWGKVLSKIEVDPLHRIVWSSVSKADLEESDARPEETEGIIDELMSNAPGSEVILLFKDNLDGVISCSIRTLNFSIDATEIARQFGGGGHRQAAGFKRMDGKAIELVVAETLEWTKQWQGTRLGLGNLSTNTTPSTETGEENTSRIARSKGKQSLSIPTELTESSSTPTMVEGLDVIAAMTTASPSDAMIKEPIPTSEPVIQPAAPAYEMSEVVSRETSTPPSAPFIPEDSVERVTTSAPEIVAASMVQDAIPAAQNADTTGIREPSIEEKTPAEKTAISAEPIPSSSNEGTMTENQNVTLESTSEETSSNIVIDDAEVPNWMKDKQ